MEFTKKNVMDQVALVKKTIIDNDVVNFYLETLINDIGEMEDDQWEYFPRMNLSDKK
ncbi:hypothetical protein [Enterococcus termitis]|uniref:hypothetical protein n=1 Tax=Enterococcus termitis TaxID=332950 RepID=UPI00091F64B9|nr:hypothetical protein [Enterococcus termitis]OJG98377.1 hypothetical protein RV18_GL003278 [Enterococcus termitis]